MFLSIFRGIIMKSRKIANIGWILVILGVLLCAFVFISGFRANAALDGTTYIIENGEYPDETIDRTEIETVICNEVSDIPENAFSNCPNLSEVKLKSTTIGTGAFAGCQSLSSVTIDGNVSIGGGAFANDSALSSVSISGTAAIGSNAFSANTSLENFSASSVSSVASDSFSGCSKLFEIKNAGASDGAIYNGTTLIGVLPTASSVTLRSGTTAIADNVFKGSDVSELEIPDPTSISNLGAPSGWQYMHVLVDGAATDVFTTFEDKLDEAGLSVYFEYLDGPTNYKVTVLETFKDKTGETTIKQNQDIRNLPAGQKIEKVDYPDYEFISGNSPYTVTKSETVEFVYKAISDTPVPPPGEGHKVTFVYKFWKEDGKTTDTSKIVPPYSFDVSDSTKLDEALPVFDGYDMKDYSSEQLTLEIVNGKLVSNPVTNDATVTFNFVKKKGSPTPDPTPTPDPKPNPKPNSSGGGKGGSAATPKPVQQTPVVTPGQPIQYIIIEGADQVVKKNPGIVSMRCNGEYSKFLNVMMDGNEVDKANYTTKEGSTILDFTEAYTATLSEARHHIRFVYTDGYADTTLTVGNVPVAAAAPASSGKVSAGGSKTTTTVTYTVSADGTVTKGHVKDSTPKTADGFDERYLLCLAILLCGIGAILFSKTRKIEIIASHFDD